MSTLHREFCEKKSTLQRYENLIIDSPEPMKVFRDQTALFFMWARKGRFSHRFFAIKRSLHSSQTFRLSGPREKPSLP